MPPPTIRDLRVEYRPVNALTAYAGNARTHSAKQLRQIAESIKAFGWTNPILIDEGGGVIAGHGRLEAARQLGLESVPVICLADMTEAQKRAYIIADNKLAENAGWDNDLLRVELVAIEALKPDFSLPTIGFETPELDLLLHTDEGGEEEPAPEPAPGQPVSKVGDLWILGTHRLLVGNSLDAASYAAVTNGEPAAAMFTDPPYNVPVNGHVCGLGKIRHEEFVMASGEMSEAEFRAFLETFMDHARCVLQPGAVAFVCMDWRHITDVIGAGRSKLGDLINLCFWNKMTGGMGSLYRSQHELVPVFRVPGAPHRNNVELGRHGRNRTNVWNYTGVQARRGELKMHPTVKPVAMIRDAIMDVTARGDLVLDPFAGSGSTLIAAQETGRRAACIELDPKYADVIIRRFRDATGIEARHAVWDQAFSEIEAEMEAPADGK